MSGRRIRGLKARVGREGCISKLGLVGKVAQWRNASWRSLGRESQCWLVWNLQKNQGYRRKGSLGSESCLEF